MKILALSWEFPPRIVGGIARHVAELYPEIVKLGHEVHLITVKFGEAPLYEVVDGIHIHRVPAGGHHFFQWVGNMNEHIGEHGGKLILEEKNFDLIHAHDWLVADSAIALKHIFKLPLVGTIHATEWGRHNGIHNQTQHYIYSKEHELTFNSWRVIVCSNYMKKEVEHILTCPADKIDVVYNGIKSEKKPNKDEFDARAWRAKFATEEEKIVYYLGRMTPEKGIAVLINAAPMILHELGGRVKFVIVGGGKTDYLKQLAWDLGISEKVYFTGFMSEEDLDKFQVIADCAVFPSLYEPFGIVALESFATRVPVVVSNAGGLPEVVQHGVTGIVTEVNNSESLAWGILEILQKEDLGQYLTRNAFEDLKQRFDWAKLAKQTEMVYQQVVNERLLVDW